MVSKLGNFELIDELGGGAWGKVYLARQVTLGGRLVAVKVLWPHLAADERARQRFLDEARSMGSLKHRNIANVIDYGEEDGTCYFAMEYVEGESLGEVIAREGPMSAGRVAELGAQIADALAHAHNRGVVHRDIKPGNILLDCEGRPVVTDFGIAKIGEGTGLTATGASIGTPEYMSPEQAEDNPVDGRSDIYSLGAVLYHMVCGQAPFTGTTPLVLAKKHVEEPARHPRELRPNCPDWLATIILRALAKEPFDRFGTAQEMAAALQDEPVTPITETIDVPGSGVGIRPPQPEPTHSRAGPNWAVLAVLSAIVGVLALIVVIWTLGHPPAPRTTSRPPAPSDGGPSPPAPREPIGAGRPAKVPAQSPSLTESEVRSFLFDEWLQAQNNRDFDKYRDCYATDFVGIKRTKSGRKTVYDYDGWMNDRRPMLQKPGLQVAILSINSIELTDKSATVQIEQRFRTSRYGDRGPKVFELRGTDVGLKIVHEEMLASYPLE